MKSTEKVLADLEKRLEEAIEKNEDMTWDSFLPNLSPHNVESGRRYRGWSNLFFLGFKMISVEDDPRFITFAGCKRMGSYVKKGTTMTPIWQPIIAEVDNGNGGKDKTFRGFRTIKVCSVRETTLIEDGKVPATLGEENPDEEPQDLVEFFGKVPYQTEKCQKGNAYYNPYRDKVGVPEFVQFANAFGWAEATAHELIHWTGHKSRLDRDMQGKMHSQKDRSAEELVACIGACFLLHDLGVELGESEIYRQTAYLKSWMPRLQGDMQFLLDAAEKAGKAVDYIKKLAAGESVEDIERRAQDAA